jgi:pyruvate/2-oxoglutarate dehydrogenase complex dihydrolipoamide dehydrogenase (E3) component
MSEAYDLVVIGGGSAGLMAAEFAARLGACVVLVEKHRIGGDCTWTGCVPSKALLKAAKVAHETRNTAHYGVLTAQPQVDMAQVREYIREAIQDRYQHETPEQLIRRGVDVVIGAARFLDPHALQVGERTLYAKKFVVATGAKPFIPDIPGLREAPFVTYLDIFENDHLPERLIVIGAGPIGAEISQAYQRLGSQVTLVDVGLLPRDEPEVAQVMGEVFAREGIRFVEGLVSEVREAGDEVEISVQGQRFQGDLLLVTVSRKPVLTGLDLENAGVAYSSDGIQVDDKLRTTAKHIYAAGDCIGGPQFTHFAGWQGYKAARNALLPGSSTGFEEWVPWTTFTDPEVAHVGLAEAQAREKHGNMVRVACWDMAELDRAVAENNRDGFIKIVHHKDGTLLGATIVSERAGEAITEFVQALKHGLKMRDLSSVMHVYPTYSTAVQRLAGDVAMEDFLTSRTGKLVRSLSI